MTGPLNADVLTVLDLHVHHIIICASSTSYQSDIDFDYETMKDWSKRRCEKFFENGGKDVLEPEIECVLEGNRGSGDESDDAS